MAALPNETLTTIFDELSPSSLAAVARVSTRFNAVAERLLYSSIYITDILTESSPLPWKTIWWCKAMRRRVHLIDTAKKLHIRWQADPDAPPPPAQYILQTCEELSEILRALTPIESIDLFLGPANIVLHNYRLQSPGYDLIHHEPPMHAIERVIRGCQFSQLRSCTLGADSAKGVQPYTGVLISFLASLPRLRHLRLSDSGHYSQMNVHSTLDELPADALPLLCSFRGSPDAAASLLPGRPVQYLSLIGQDSDVNRDNLPRMTRTAVPLRCLDLSAMSARPMLLRNVSTYLPTVESLRVKLALRHTLHYSFSGIWSIPARPASVFYVFNYITQTHPAIREPIERQRRPKQPCGLNISVSIDIHIHIQSQ
ncbi:hypothetical protein D9613_006707 [Agrocybe pediades]|uniref:F-box domain-containing protein n=1 Tax=Agrocybe pediades TaxID=84607 RepID=A0A8H4VIC1_9AGAR|nr:hypothetical protein D9613_006707 [Agrocybe pediades]